MENENQIWYGRPSQIQNLPFFLLLGLFSWLIFPIFWMLWIWLVTRNTEFILTDERLIKKSGVLNKLTDEIELYRVRDYRFKAPLFLRLFSLGNVILITSDTTDTIFVIEAIKNGEKLRNEIRNLVEICRKRKGVRDLEVN